MRHRKGLRKLGRTSAHRRALFRNMATSLLKHEQCETTVAKAKELRSVVEGLIRNSREDTLPARRAAYGFLQDKAIVHKLFSEIGPRFALLNCVYTRVTRTRTRFGDAAEMAVIELVDRQPAAN